MLQFSIINEIFLLLCAESLPSNSLLIFLFLGEIDVTCVPIFKEED